MAMYAQRKALLLTLGSSTLALVAGAANAQVVLAAAHEEAADDQSQLSDILVTAERRDVNLQKAPLSVSAVTGDVLAQSNVTEITGLNGSVPGLVVARSGGGERVITIRGIGSETPENTNTQPGVSYHVDGVYIFNSIAANAAFIDVGQVEVLRGPQGTTFGQGSTGGTINVVTNKPSLTDFSGNIDAGYGNYSFVKANAAVNVPLSSTLAVRGAVQHLSHDGYAAATGVPGFEKYELDDQDETGWKAAVLWQPTSTFSITLNTVQYDSNANGPAQKNILDPNPDARRLSQDYAGRSKINTELYYGVARLETPFAVIKSITSYQKLHSIQAWDADALTSDLFYDLTYSPLTFGGVNYDHVPLWETNTKSWTQEVNLASNSSGPFSWILGGVYLHSKNSQYIVEYRAADDEILRPALPADTPVDDPRVAALTYSELSTITRNAWAAYFEGTYELTDRLTVTGGLRYNHDKYSGTAATNSDLPASGPYLQPTPTPGLSTEKVTGKAAMQYQLAPSNMVYLSYTRGFKPGGLNSSAANAAPALLGFEMGTQPTYKPETVDSFEVGSKNRFLNGTAQLNVSGFLYNYKNMQFLEEDAVLYGEGISNAPRARIYGVELEGSWLMSHNLSVDGSVSILDGEFTRDYYALDPVAASAAQNAAGYPGFLFWSNFYPAALARDAARANIKGNSVPKLPSVQGSASIRYTHRVGPGELTARGQYIYRGKYNYRLFNESSTDITPSYSQVNLFLSYQPDDTQLTFSITATNLFNKNGINSRFSDPYGSAQTYNTYIPPRQVIGSVGIKF
jgi:iron complex outermembrane recepter protein